MRALETDGRHRNTQRSIPRQGRWESPQLRSVAVPAVDVRRPEARSDAPPAGWRNDSYVGQMPVNMVIASRDSISYQPSAEMIGLTAGSATTPRRASVEFAMYFVQFGEELIFRIYESGTFIATVGSIGIGDHAGIRRELDGTVRYTLNGATIYTSERVATRELFFHSSYWSQAFSGDTPDASGLTVVAS